MKTTRSYRWAAVTMADSPQIEGRLRAILDGERRRQTTTGRALGAALLTAGLLLPLACIRPTTPDRAPAAKPAAEASETTRVGWKEPLPADMTPASEFAGTIRGVTVKVVGVSTNPPTPRAARPWWTPDGAPLAEALYDFARVWIGPGEDMKNKKVREVAVVVEPGSAAPIALRYQFLDGESGEFLTPIDREGREIKRTNVALASFPQSQERSTLLVGVAAGPWEDTVERGFKPSGENTFTRSSAGSVLLSPLGDLAGGGAFITVTDNLLDRDHRMVAITADGKQHVAQGEHALAAKTTSFGGASLEQALSTFSRMRQTQFVFPGLSAKSIREVRFQTRPYQWLRFDNIALDPATSSNTGGRK